MTISLENEYFRWHRETWDIAKVLRDINAGELTPKLVDISPSFVTAYATQYLGLDKTQRGEQARSGLMVRVNAKNALELPQHVLHLPLILLCPRKGLGIFQLEGSTSHDHVLADGNHRIARAFFDDISGLKAFVLTPSESARYRLA